MQQYFFNFMIILGASATLLISPCQAQTPTELNEKSSNNPKSLNSSPVTEVTNSGNDTNKDLPILSQVDSNSSASNSDVAVKKPEPRIPIFSRIFPAPSMQQ
ncbi:MAG: hypothetical protein KME21_01180 [Desmonostoc vinosum HA7617-LM4]|jgi:hypothetical protein|nr:hypothetical protein [Desmonostoc vinosum HA7617-LM4]